MAKEVRCGFGMCPFTYQASLHLRFAAPAGRFVTASWFVPDRDGRANSLETSAPHRFAGR